MASNVQPPADTTTRVSTSTVESAVNALFKYKAAHSANEKLQLLPQDDYIYLNLTLKKIPSNPRTSPYQIPLSHPILDQTSELCLIIDDRPQSPTPPSEQIKKLIKSQNIPISKVIKISKLKANYKPFEAKRKLCDSYDLFLVDKRVVHLLPKLIGKEFFKKKKLPLGVDLGKKNLKLQVERALGSALLYLRTGTCCVMKVGKVAMEKNEVVENVLDAINGGVERVPKKWDGVRSLHLKFYDSLSLPVYQAIPDTKLKIEVLKEREKGAELAKTSDNEGEIKEINGRKDGKSGKGAELAKTSDNEGEVKEIRGGKDGKIGKKKKGRIHEVRYMDAGEYMESDSDDDVDESEQAKSEDNDEFMGQKRTEENLMEESEDENDKIEVEGISPNETVGRKRNKGGALKDRVLGVLNGEKQVKKKAKSEKSRGGRPKKDGLSDREASGAEKGKKKNELGKKLNERIAKVKDSKTKKRM